MADPTPTTTITWNDVRAYVKGNTADEDFLTQCAQAATERVTEAVGSATVPPAVLKTAMLEVAANLWNRRQNTLDAANLGDGSDTTPAFFRPALDPMTPARAILRPYLTRVGLA